MRGAGAVAVPEGENSVSRADHLLVAREVRVLGCGVTIGHRSPHLQAEATTHRRVPDRRRSAMCSTGQDYRAARQRLDLRVNDYAITDAAAAASEDPQISGRLWVDDVDTSGLSCEGVATVLAWCPISVPGCCHQMGVRVRPPRSFDHVKARPAVWIAHAPSPPPGRRFHHPALPPEPHPHPRPRPKPPLSPKPD